MRKRTSRLASPLSSRTPMSRTQANVDTQYASVPAMSRRRRLRGRQREEREIRPLSCCRLLLPANYPRLDAAPDHTIELQSADCSASPCSLSRSVSPSRGSSAPSPAKVVFGTWSSLLPSSAPPPLFLRWKTRQDQDARYQQPAHSARVERERQHDRRTHQFSDSKGGDAEDVSREL
jgi:hypothetical protein